MVLNEWQEEHLLRLYTKLYQLTETRISMTTVCMKYMTIECNNNLFGANRSKSSSSSNALVTRDSSPVFSQLSSQVGNQTLTEHACRIEYFIKHSIVIDGNATMHLFAVLSWYKPHPDYAKLGKPFTVWYHDLFEPPGIHNFLPVQFLTSRTVSLIDKLGGKSVLFLCSCIY